MDNEIITSCSFTASYIKLFCDVSYQITFKSVMTRIIQLINYFQSRFSLHHRQLKQFLLDLKCTIWRPADTQ